jgi:hypothetical protein
MPHALLWWTLSIGVFYLRRKVAAKPPPATTERGKALLDLIVRLIVGAVAGWHAGLIVKGYGFGLLGNIVVGVVEPFETAA